MVSRGGRGRAGALMARVAVRESVTVAGLAERVRVARAFVGGVLGQGHPCGDDAQLLVSDCSAIACGTAGRAVLGETVTAPDGYRDCAQCATMAAMPAQGNNSLICKSRQAEFSSGRIKFPL